MKTLEMIITRKDEPVGGFISFMDSLFAQRNINRDCLRVTLVQMDGKDVPEELKTKLKAYPVEVRILRKECVNQADAKNYALKNADAENVMFMDYADIFPDVYSMSMILNLIPSSEFDIIWMQYYAEHLKPDGNLFINVIRDADAGTCGKVFRTKFLIDNNLMYDETLYHDEDRVFYMAAVSITDYTRFGKIATEFIPYTHTYRDENEGISAFEILKRQHETNLAVLRNVEKHTHNEHFIGAVMKTICDAYNFTNVDVPMREMPEMEREVAQFYDRFRMIIDRVKKQDLEIVLDDSQKDMINLIQRAYRIYGYELYFDTDRIPFRNWLKKLDRSAVTADTPQKTDAVGREEKVAVFCGTRNVYDCMETAAKSLAAHTRMDRIYFFIEDNNFPRPLPEFIRCVNVKDQQFFPASGRNYNNAWTYMCMMRAAFAKLMPEEHKVLSLDIDVVVNEDISELWDVDLSEYYIAGVEEPDRTAKLKDTYINFGVVMMNLDKIRASGVDDRIIDSLNRDRWGCPEQDAFNHFCKPDIFPLDPMYNTVRVAHITGESDREKISHYAGIKYWKHFKPFRRYAKLSWKDIVDGNIPKDLRDAGEEDHEEA